MGWAMLTEEREDGELVIKEDWGSTKNWKTQIKSQITYHYKLNLERYQNKKIG